MKKFTAIILTLTLGYFSDAFAGHYGSILRLNVAGHAPYMIRLNNGWATHTGRTVVFDNLNPGYHQITVTRPNGYHPGRIVFSGSVFVPAASEVTARIERGGYLTIIGTRELFAVCEPVPSPIVFDQPAVCPAPVYYPSAYPAGYPAVTNSCPGAFVPVNVPVCHEDFMSIRDEVAGTVFESTRMEIARQLIRDRFLTTAQVMSLMELFDFDSNRLEIAKFAYSRTVDRERYHQTYSMFTFDSNVRELSRFIYANS